MSDSKFEVSEFCRAFEFLDWGDGLYSSGVGTKNKATLVYRDGPLPPLFSTTTMIIDTNGTPLSPQISKGPAGCRINKDYAS